MRNHSNRFSGYLETILMLQKSRGQVRSINIANEMNFTKPSVSVAMKNLREKGYITMDNTGYITLTDAGRQRAFLAGIENHSNPS